MTPITTKLVPVAEIVTDAGTQIRAAISEATVDDYAGDMAAGDKFPPVVVYHDGNQFILADGFHRFFATKRNGADAIRCEVHTGTRADALRYALSANYSHGLRRTNADKRRSVEMALSEWPKLSDAETARVCSVSHPFVADVRRSVQPVTFTGCETRIGADGKERKLPTNRNNRIVEPREIAETPEDENAIEAESSHQPEEPAAHEVLAALKIEPAVTEYYAKLEAVMLDAIANATDKQLASMSVYAALLPKLIKDELRRRGVK